MCSHLLKKPLREKLVNILGHTDWFIPTFSRVYSKGTYHLGKIPLFRLAV